MIYASCREHVTNELQSNRMTFYCNSLHWPSALPWHIMPQRGEILKAWHSNADTIRKGQPTKSFQDKKKIYSKPSKNCIESFLLINNITKIFNALCNSKMQVHLTWWDQKDIRKIYRKLLHISLRFLHEYIYKYHKLLNGA